MVERGDPYHGNDPRLVWQGYRSDLGGLRPLAADRRGRMDYWSTVEASLEQVRTGIRLMSRRVIELGPGENTDFRDYCVRHDASEYVGVDLFSTPSLPPQRLGSTTIKYVQEDMLKFLARQPSQSVMVASFALLSDEMLDAASCRHLGLKPEDIMESCAREIIRVLLPGECFITINTRGRFDQFLRQAAERVSRL